MRNGCVVQWLWNDCVRLSDCVSPFAPPQVCNFVIGFAFLPVSKALGIAGVYTVFAAVCFLAV